MPTKQMGPGSSQREFFRLAALETDDCVIWPYAKAGQRGYGLFYIASKPYYAHREALRFRVPQPFDAPYALHGPCNNPACMNYRHLRWGSPRENNLDRRRDGTALLGSRHPQSKLTTEAVRDLRTRYAAGTAQRALAQEYGVSVMTVNRAIRGESWSET